MVRGTGWDGIGWGGDLGLNEVDVLVIGCDGCLIANNNNNNNNNNLLPMACPGEQCAWGENSCGHAQRAANRTGRGQL